MKFETLFVASQPDDPMGQRTYLGVKAEDGTGRVFVCDDLDALATQATEWIFHKLRGGMG